MFCRSLALGLLGRSRKIKFLQTFSESTVVKSLVSISQMSLVMRKPDFSILENKDADQLRGGDRKADQRLCFPYTNSVIPLLPKYEISSL